jgi:hypothetical protein
MTIVMATEESIISRNRGNILGINEHHNMKATYVRCCRPSVLYQLYVSLENEKIE